MAHPIFQAPRLPPSAPESPSFWQGLSDVISTPQRAVLGAAEAMFTGGDFGESVQQAIASRRSFGDILREQGASPGVSGVLGFGADVLTDPLNMLPIGAGLKLMGKGAGQAGALARRSLLAENALPRGVKQILEEVPDLAHPEKKMARLRGEAASAAFRKHVPEGSTRAQVGDVVWLRALADAKKVAFTAGGKGRIDFGDSILQGEFSQGLLRRAAAQPQLSRFKRLMEDAGEARRMFVSNLGTALRKDPAFGSQGPDIAAGLEHSEDLADALEGERRAFYYSHIRPLLKSTEERINFTELAGGEGVKAISPSVGAAVALYRRFDNEVIFKDSASIGLRELVPKTHSMGQEELFPEIAASARDRAVGGRGEWVPVPIQYRQNHVPHFYSQAAVKELKREGSELRQQAVKKLVSNGMAENDTHGAKVLDEMLHAEDGYFVPSEFRGGPLQFSRELLLDVAWEKDPDKWFPRYAHLSSKRIAQGAVFGAQDEKLDAWLQSVRAEGGDAGRAENIRNLIIGRPSREQSRFHGAATAIGAAQTIMGLGPRTALLQFMQLANTAGAYGIGTTIRGLGAVLRDPDVRKLAKEAGALLPSESLSWEGDIGASWSAWWVHNVTKMPAADRAVRSVSGTTAMLAAKQWGEVLQAGGSSIASRGLARLGIDVEQVIAQGGELSAAQLKTAFLEGAKYTQFASHLSDMPEMWKSPLGRFMFKFRAFAKQQSRFVGTLVDEAMKHNNPKPLMRYIAAYAGLYTAAKPSLDFLAGRHKPVEEEQAMDYLKGLLFAGAMGATGDFFTNATSNDPTRVLGMLTGPSASQAAQTTTDIGALLAGRPQPILRDIRRTLETPMLRPLELLRQP